MKLRRAELQVPPEDPFKNDQLERQKYAKVLTAILTSIEEPFVLSIEAGWGHGKSTFVRMWSQQLQNENYVCLNFNAWESDFATDPLVSLVGEITVAIEKMLGSTSGARDHLAQFKKAGIEIAKRSIPVAAKILTAGVLDIDQFSEKSYAEAVEGLLKEKFEDYEKNKKSLQTFRITLEQLVADIQKKGHKLPVIFFVDELDRCRPPYAIALLERLKHLFNVPNIVFALAIDKQQLEESIKGMYGQGCDAKRYLRRFIDMEYVLPEPNQEQFSRFLSKQYGFDEGFARASTNANEVEHFVWAFSRFSKIYGLRLRDQEHACGSLAIAWRTTPKGEHLNPFVCGFLVALKIGDNATYRELSSDELSISTYLKRMQKHWDDGGLFAKPEGYGYALEAFLILYVGSDADVSAQQAMLRKNATGDAATARSISRYEVQTNVFRHGSSRQDFDRLILRLNASDYFVYPAS